MGCSSSKSATNAHEPSVVAKVIDKIEHMHGPSIIQIRGNDGKKHDHEDFEHDAHVANKH
jgi:hypothetical protein